MGPTRSVEKVVWETLVVRVLACFVIASGAAFAQPPSPAREMLQTHNSIRLNLGLPALAWSDRLAAIAQEWAEALLKRNEFFHRPKSSYGENLYKISGRNAAASAREVVQDWAAESKNYDYKSNLCHGVCGHYTQIIWRGTREVGCGVARGTDQEVWVCEYSPPGNWVGKRPY
jgi:pathogenesis-related protein 1